MSSMMIDLGWCMARIRSDRAHLTIVAPSAETQLGFIPSATVHIDGKQDLIALRDALISALPLSDGDRP